MAWTRSPVKAVHLRFASPPEPKRPPVSAKIRQAGLGKRRNAGTQKRRLARDGQGRTLPARM